MHKGHMTGCAIAIGLALVLFATTGGSIGGLGLLLAVLICPITMGAVMWFLMGSQRKPKGPTPMRWRPRRRRSTPRPPPADDPARAPRHRTDRPPSSRRAGGPVVVAVRRTAARRSGSWPQERRRSSSREVTARPGTPTTTTSAGCWPPTVGSSSPAPSGGEWSSTGSVPIASTSLGRCFAWPGSG